MRHLCIPVDIAPGSQVERAICADETVLRVLRRVAGIKLRKRAGVEIQRIPRKIRQQIEARGQSSNPVAGRAGGGREDVAVIGFVDFATRIPEKATQREPERCKFRGLFLWGAGRCCRIWQ